MGHPLRGGVLSVPLMSLELSRDCPAIVPHVPPLDGLIPTRIKTDSWGIRKSVDPCISS